MGTVAEGKAAKSSERSAVHRILTARARHQRARDRPSQSRTATEHNGAADSAVELWPDRSGEIGKDL
jgi:hypothetical protein